MIPQAHLQEVVKHCEKICLRNQNNTEDAKSCDLPQI